MVLGGCVEKPIECVANPPPDKSGIFQSARSKVSQIAVSVLTDLGEMLKIGLKSGLIFAIAGEWVILSCFPNASLFTSLIFCFSMGVAGAVVVSLFEKIFQK